jgi:hypothetical protein
MLELRYTLVGMLLGFGIVAIVIFLYTIGGM